MMWGGRFQKEESEDALAFNASLSFDQRLYREDIAGSLAHADMLAENGILSAEDKDAIQQGLQKIKKEIEDGVFPFSIHLEDIHMNIEKRLTDDIGEAGRRLHTARSRNDQCAVDLHLYLKRKIITIAEKLLALEEALTYVAEKNKEVIMPGYTHLQEAQPILFSHHMMAYHAMLTRDFKRLMNAYDEADQSPLGACALAGTTYPTKPQDTAKKLHFKTCYTNSLDAVSDRDYLLEFLSFASLCMMHLSRLSEELILWSTAEFHFIEIDDAYSTGSSIMPQKKNPDMCELIRGKTGRVYGHLTALLTMMKGLPLAYDKDMQEDKEGLFDTIDTLIQALTIYTGLIKTLTVHGNRTKTLLEKGFANATDMADYLTKKGIPFREAHALTGKAVHHCLTQGKVLKDLTLSEFREISPAFEEDVYQAIDIETCIRHRESYGGTGYGQVERQKQEAKEVHQTQKAWTEKKKKEMEFLT